jgi:hypothetical protein
MRACSFCRLRLICDLMFAKKGHSCTEFTNSRGTGRG